jgi:hypothetical protein
MFLEAMKSLPFIDKLKISVAKVVGENLLANLVAVIR